jgi:hypothetical protein
MQNTNQRRSNDDDKPVMYLKLEDENFHEVSKHVIQIFIVCISCIDANKFFCISCIGANKFFLFQLSSWSFTFPIHSERSAQHEVSCIFVICCFVILKYAIAG